MMLYEYKCVDCELVFNAHRRMADRREPINCPACDGEGKFKISTPRFKSTFTKGWDGKGVIK